MYGYPDIFVTSYGSNVLYHNNGNGTFTDVTAKAGVAGGGWSASAGFLDYDNDGRLDLFVTRYMEWNTKQSKVCNGEYRTYCPPIDFPTTTNLLYHNNGDGTFTDASAGSGIGRVKGRSLGVAFNDYDGDGYTDIFVANDGMQQFLFHNNKDGTFSERALEAGVALSDDGKPLCRHGRRLSRLRQRRPARPHHHQPSQTDLCRVPQRRQRIFRLQEPRDRYRHTISA